MKTKTALRLLFIAAGAAALYCISREECLPDLRKKLDEELGTRNDDKGDPVGMPNPLRTLSAAGFSELSGIELDNEELASSHPRFYSISTDPVLYGVELEDSDCLKYDFRFCSRSYNGDISGMYYEWTRTDRYPGDDPVCEVFLNETGQGVCRWKDEDRKYTISMKEGASLVKLVWMRQRLCTLMTLNG